MLNAILQKLDYQETDVLQYSDKPWLSHYQKGVPESKIYDEICLPEVLKNRAESHPDRMALVFEGFRLSYGRLNEMVDRMAACLWNLGIRKGDRVALLLPNCIPCIAGYYAILKIGGIAVMNNPLYSDRELLYQFNDSGAKLLITLDLLANRMIDLRPKTAIQDIIYTSLGDYLPFPKNHLFKLVAKRRKLAADVKPASRVHRWKDLLKNSPVPGPRVKVRPDDIAMYQYTGGTTGISKGVLLSHRNLSVQVQQISAWCPELHCDDGVMLGALPFFHVFGLSTTMNFAIYMGWGNILLPRPTPETLLKAIRKFRPSFAPLVPTMFIGILEHPDIEKTDLTSLRGCFSGSAPLPVEVIRKFEQKTGAVIVEGYGLTEASPVTHVNPFTEGKRKVGSIGVPISDTLCRIVDLEDGKTEVPVGKPGELLIQGPQVMQGYWNMPGETENVMEDGWLRTGDVAVMDADGYFYIVDRKKDMIISSGYNVYPREIEEVLHEHPKVQEVCAVGIPHSYRGEAVKAYVILKESQTATCEELIEFCKPRLARYKLPEEIEFRSTLPKSIVGKVLRKDLKKELLQTIRPV